MMYIISCNIIRHHMPISRLHMIQPVDWMEVHVIIQSVFVVFENLLNSVPGVLMRWKGAGLLSITADNGSNYPLPSEQREVPDKFKK